MTLTPEGYRPRIIDSEIKNTMELFGAVCIEGPKWCGKTWAAMDKANSIIALNDPKNNFANKYFAEVDPYSTITGEYPRLIDEWQEVPKLWDAVRYEVDHNKKSHFILTGSSTPNNKGIHHSGVGRIAIVRMRTMSLFESGDSSGKISLKNIMKNDIETTPSENNDLDTLIDLCIRGGWPESIDISPEKAGGMAKRYLDSLVRLDTESVDGTRRDSSKIMMLIRSLARNESTVVSNNTLIKDMSKFDKESASPISVSTYLDILESLHILEEQPAFSPNLRSSIRIGKSPKRHLTDPSLDIAALNLTKDMLKEDLNFFGLIFESMVERDLSVYSQANGGKLMHYRDANGREVDSVIEYPDGSYGLFEIKLGTNQIDKAAENLLKIKDVYEKDGVKSPSALCVICGTAPAAYMRNDGVSVVPITAMRE